MFIVPQFVLESTPLQKTERSPPETNPAPPQASPDHSAIILVLVLQRNSGSAPDLIESCSIRFASL
jgi:hypothetical protein